MAKQLVNVGTVANDDTGDPLRTAFIKINDNADELYADTHTHANKTTLDATEEAFTTTLKNKLDAIEENAKDDLTAAEIKTLYESNANTEAFTTTEQTKLASIDDNADVTSVNETSHADVVVDGDFTLAGLMKTDGAGGYSTITDDSTNWDTAYTHSQSAHAPTDADNTAANETSHADVVVDGDFTTNGYMKRTGAGA